MRLHICNGRLAPILRSDKLEGLTGGIVKRALSNTWFGDVANETECETPRTGNCSVRSQLIFCPDWLTWIMELDGFGSIFSPFCKNHRQTYSCDRANFFFWNLSCLWRKQAAKYQLDTHLSISYFLDLPLGSSSTMHYQQTRNTASKWNISWIDIA